MSEPLEVWLFDRVAGLLEEDQSARLRFRYSPAWVAGGLPPLSQSLPLRTEPFDDDQARPFFSGLLPEGVPRRALAQRFGLSAGNDFGLLGEVGRECAGAVSVAPSGERPPTATLDQVRWLDEAELAGVVAELPTRPLFDDPEEGVRLSLAGVQDKMPVVCHGGRIGITAGQTPSTHILKAPIQRFDDTVANEAFCLRLAAALGLRTATAEISRAEGHDFLLVERYDREVESHAIRRLHQEDFCQALGVPPERKYEAEGGPSLAACAALLRTASASPAQDLLALVDAASFNLLSGNHDAHAKNLSLLYSPIGAGLAPLYDLVCTAAYRGLSRKMAMKLGGEYRPLYVERRHVERFAEGCGLGPAAVRRRMLRMAISIGDLAADLFGELREQGEHRPVLDRVLALIQARAAGMQRVLA